MKIGELAQAAGCEVQTIRYYERERLLPAPNRTATNYRAYGPAHLQRLQFIRRCRSLDMTLQEIRTLLHFRDSPEENCGEVNEVVEAHLRHVASRLKELTALETELKRLRRQCRAASKAAQCGILSELSSGAPKDKTRGTSHVKGATR